MLSFISHRCLVAAGDIQSRYFKKGIFDDQINIRTLLTLFGITRWQTRGALDILFTSFTNRE